LTEGVENHKDENITKSKDGDTMEIPLTLKWVPLIATHNSHHVNIYIGSPPQRRLVIVDTGSRTLVIPCKPCTHCGTKHFSKDFLDLNYSTTDYSNQCHLKECKLVSGGAKECSQENDQCSFMQSYSEGSSIQGFELEDIIWLGTDQMEESIKVHMKNAVPLSFGCESHETGIVADQYADGIMGFISEEEKQDNIVDAMYKSGVMQHHAFSMCLTKDGGVLSLGGTALTQRHLEHMKMMPLESSHYYTVSVSAFYINDVNLVGEGTLPELLESFNEGKGTVIDSGTTDTFLPLALKNQFNKVWRKFTHSRHSNKIQSYTFEQFQKLPNVTIELSSGYKWEIQPHAYMDEVRLETDTHVLDTRTGSGWNGILKFVSRIYVEEPEGAVLGSNAMVDHDILFDVEHKMVGIAKASCQEPHAG
jgi:hypothetical protein